MSKVLNCGDLQFEYTVGDFSMPVLMLPERDWDAQIQQGESLILLGYVDANGDCQPLRDAEIYRRLCECRLELAKLRGEV